MKFKLSESFINNFRGKQPKWGQLGYITYKRTYARTLEDGTVEEFWQTLQRVVEGVYSIQKKHCFNLGLPWNQYKAQKSAQKMYQMMWDFKFLPPGRGLWMMGTKYVEERGGACLNNCAFVSTKHLNVEFSSPFVFLMDMLMVGAGCGIDTRGAGTVILKEPKYTDIPFVVEDSREGWLALIETILDSFVGKTYYPKNIDYSNIRPEGSLLKSFGGISSGYKPLKGLVEDITNLLMPAEDGESEITSTQIVDTVNFIAKAVVTGNVRRSATIVFGTHDDVEYLNLKLDKKALKSHRWTSNNSIFCEKGMQYSNLVERTTINGEPGYFWLENARNFGRMNGTPDYKDIKVDGTNPCSEQSLESYEVCNLVEVFPTNHSNYEEFEQTLKMAYLYAKSVTLVRTHNERTNAVMMRNRRIGTSVSGITSAFKKFGKREFLNWCDAGYKYIKAMDEIYSDWLCVPRSIKVTTVKPSGTISLLPGVPPGIHYPHSKYYIRNIRFSENSPYVPILKNAGYKVETSLNEPNTVVVSFPVEEKYYDKSKFDVSVWEQAENVAQMQQYWSDNQVSATVTFKSSEKNDIKPLLELYESRLKSISFLPLDNKVYEQAPYIAITEEEYEEMMSKIKPYDLSKVGEHELDDSYCSNDKCEIK